MGQVSVTCSDCSTASAVFLAISCDAAVLPELNHSDGLLNFASHLYHI